jgi:hypothetical protein
MSFLVADIFTLIHAAIDFLCVYSQISARPVVFIRKPPITKAKPGCRQAKRIGIGKLNNPA